MSEESRNAAVGDAGPEAIDANRREYKRHLDDLYAAVEADLGLRAAVQADLGPDAEQWEIETEINARRDEANRTLRDAMQVTASIEVMRTTDETEEDVLFDATVSGTVRLPVDPIETAAEVTVDQAGDLTARELATAEDKLLAAAEAIDANRREYKRHLDDLCVAVGLEVAS